MIENGFKSVCGDTYASVVRIEDGKAVETVETFHLSDDFAALKAKCSARDMNGEKGKSANQMIAASYKEAAIINCSPVDFIHDDECEYDDISPNNDYREDTESRGVIINCCFCGTACLFDDDGESQDYDRGDSFHHCSDSDCGSNAIIANCL